MTMGNLFLLFFFQGPCKPCCSKDPTSPAYCGGDFSKCSGCEGPGLAIDYYLYLFLFLAIIYGSYILFKANNKKAT